MSYSKQNKRRKQTLKSAEHKLELITLNIRKHMIR